MARAERTPESINRRLRFWDRLSAFFVVVALLAVLILVPLASFRFADTLRVWGDFEILFCSFVLADLVMDGFLVVKDGITMSRLMVWSRAMKGAEDAWTPTYAHAFWGYFVGIIGGGVVGASFDLAWQKFPDNLTLFSLLTLFSVVLVWVGFRRLISTDRTHLIPRPRKSGAQTETEGSEAQTAE